MKGAPAVPRSETANQPLIGPDDPPPVEWVNRDNQSPVLLVCEHAGQAVPARLNGLGLPPGAIDRHIGWDIGAEPLARRIAELLAAPLVLQRYSRLVVDCNRPPSSDGFIPLVSDQCVIPGNQHLGPQELLDRKRGIFDPLDVAITQGFASAPRKGAFAIHTFTRQMQGGDRREWDAGFLCRRDLAAANTLMTSIARARPDLVMAVNEPYQIDDVGDWFIPVHAEARGMRHTLIEVCNDQVQTDAQIEHWALLIADAIRDVLESI
jgi:predicted N-formylglutamate amidohydrolase